MTLQDPASRRLALLALALALALPAGSVRAADDPWIRYENASFTAYSSAPEKKVLALLEELETFRAAFLQVANIPLPPDASRTLVLVPASPREFKKLTASPLVAGFAQNDGRRTLIVMPVYGDRNWTKTVVRHEYGHALLRYKRFPYPAWYEEGFAELVSSTQLVNKGQSFTIGTPPLRAKQNGPPQFDWNALVSRDFQPDRMTNREKASSAYAQAWLLAHYATLGNDLKNAPKLQAYFDRLTAGESLGDAFEESFGMTADELWDRELKAYTKRIPGYTFPYRPGAVDLDFSRGPAAVSEVDGIVHYLELRSAIDDKPQPPQDVLAALKGRWAPLRIGLECENVLEFDAGSSAGTLTVKGASGHGEAASYRYQLAGDGSVVLVPVGDDAGDGEKLRIRQRTNDLLCMAPDNDDHDDDACSRAAFRCASATDRT
ncbi:MAG: hypothetical protein ABI567_06215 [Gammaproteobacteria bacterium]